ncbi:MAG TPA: hypothetical protein EYP14_15965, partial [Planctomycetaceae bacterium]|nr:hypothetical protein [Planctomycetaceae bacterium]
MTEHSIDQCRPAPCLSADGHHEHCDTAEAPLRTSQSFSRRNFLARAACAASGVCFAPRLAVGRDATPNASPDDFSASTLPIIDTHQHLWDLRRFRLPWLEGPKERPHPLRRNFLMADYLEAAAGLNIVRTVYMEVDVDPSQHVAEAEWVIDMCRRTDNPMVAAVIGCQPDSRQFGDYVRRF